MKKTPFRSRPIRCNGCCGRFVTVGYALYLRYLAIEFSTVALPGRRLADHAVQDPAARTYLFKNSVFGVVGSSSRGSTSPAVDRAAHGG